MCLCSCWCGAPKGQAQRRRATQSPHPEGRGEDSLTTRVRVRVQTQRSGSLRYVPVVKPRRLSVWSIIFTGNQTHQFNASPRLTQPGSYPMNRPSHPHLLSSLDLICLWREEVTIRTASLKVRGADPTAEGEGCPSAGDVAGNGGQAHTAARTGADTAKEGPLVPITQGLVGGRRA